VTLFIGGVRSLTGSLTIREKIDASSETLKKYAREQGWWSEGETVFDFASVYGASADATEKDASDSAQHSVLERLAESGTVSLREWLTVG